MVERLSGECRRMMPAGHVMLTGQMMTAGVVHRLGYRRAQVQSKQRHACTSHFYRVADPGSAFSPSGRSVGRTSAALYVTETAPSLPIRRLKGLKSRSVGRVLAALCGTEVGDLVKVRGAASRMPFHHQSKAPERRF